MRNFVNGSNGVINDCLLFGSISSPFHILQHINFNCFVERQYFEDVETFLGKGWQLNFALFDAQFAGIIAVEVAIVGFEEKEVVESPRTVDWKSD